MNFFMERLAQISRVCTNGMVAGLVLATSIFTASGFNRGGRGRLVAFAHPADRLPDRNSRYLKITGNFLDFLVDLHKFFHFNSKGCRQIPCSCENREFAAQNRHFLPEKNISRFLLL
jgi:hypothetical protein